MYALFKDGIRMEVKPCQVSLEDIHKFKNECNVIGVPFMYAINTDASLVIHPYPAEGYTLEKIKE